MDADFNYFEKFVVQKVKQVKPKSKQRGYAKKLVAKMYTVIEESLNQGCDYDDIAIAISETNVKISPSTLKRYHLLNRKKFEQENLPQQQRLDQSNQKAIDSEKQYDSEKSLLSIGSEQRTTFGGERQAQRAVATEAKAKLPTQANKSTDHELESINLVDKLKLSNSSSQILSASSLTDDDYLDDFNNY
jgi:hypothetical protein